ncbi:major facilitator superfamily domain-containing protein [Lophiotrema nucula]|uniref:Major facilitator superfamily domain-containing protein n=1 Tax=Lophiotrema nucula TaxID=690887 RepID=A0A6A5ZSL3_9PLEO|nr:major facilitator superfamily domain-containing protein [Lophiotrema nucula]
MIPIGAGVNGSIGIGKQLHAPPEQAVWIAASYPLTQGAFVLVGGRFGTVYGHKLLVVIAGAWWVLFNVLSGFMTNIPSLAAMRALCGVGGAFMVPNLIALLTINIPPGKGRNIAVGMFGAMAPIGAAGGSVFPGFFVQLLPWKWLFFFLAMFGAVIFVVFVLVVPGEKEPLDKGGKIDYFGGYLGVGGLVLFNFVWNQAPIVGWTEPYEYILLIVSLLHFVAFILWSKHTKHPILPLDIWTAPSFGMMILSAFFTFMAVGIAIWYIELWELTLRHYTILEVGASWATLAVGGAVAAIVSAQVVRHFAAQYMMASGSLCTSICLILIATMPAKQIYWAQVFPALIFLSFGPDFLFTAAQIIASNTVKRKHQGAAGSLIGTILSYGISIGLGFAGTVDVYTNDGGKHVLKGYRNATYLGIGMAGAAVGIALLFVRIPKDRREGWDEDDLP